MLLRVVGVQRTANAPLCAVDVVRGHDNLMLLDQPLPASGEAGAHVRAAARAPRVRMSAPALSAPAHPLVVPGFFGGVLPLSNGLDVRLVDAEFDELPAEDDVEWGAIYEAAGGSASSQRGGGGRASHGRGGTMLEALARVRLTVVDGRGARVGEAVWCTIHELLEQIKPTACVAADLLTEVCLHDGRLSPPRFPLTWARTSLFHAPLRLTLPRSLAPHPSTGGATRPDAPRAPLRRAEAPRPRRPRRTPARHGTDAPNPPADAQHPRLHSRALVTSSALQD